MNDDLIFRLALLLVLAAFVINRAYYTKKYGRSASDARQAREGEPRQLIVAALNLFALLATGIYLLNPIWLAWASLEFPAWLRESGFALALAGFALLRWAHSALARNWSDQPRLLAGQTLTIEGPYHWIRHPIYTAFLLILSAPLFLSANWLLGSLWIVSTVLEILSRVRYEEGLMLDRFGDDYTNYANRTGRLLPRL
jgi:protein-S-isoprenylcysteine O-methyltransferase Ste14